MSRFSLRFLLLAVTIVSIALAGGTYAWKAIYAAPEAERNLGSLRFVSGSLISFVDRYERWPRNQDEIMAVAYEGGCSVGHRREEPFERVVLAYDFDFETDSLAPDTFRGIRFRGPIDHNAAEAVREELLAQLNALRDGSVPPPRSHTYPGGPYPLDRATPVGPDREPRR